MASKNKYSYLLYDDNWIEWHSLALLVDMLCVSMFSPGMMLYIYDSVRISDHERHLQ